MRSPTDIRNAALEEAAKLVYDMGENARKESEHSADSLIALVCDRLGDAILSLRRKVQ